MTLFARASRAISPAKSRFADSLSVESGSTKRPSTWSLRNWPVRWKVVAIVAVPLLLAMIFGGLRIASAVSDAHRLRLAADRAEMVPAITKYMSALDVALLGTSTGGDVEGAKKNYEARKHELQARLAGTDVAPDVSAGVDAIEKREPPKEGGLQLVAFAKAYSGLTDEEFRRIDKIIRATTIEKFGPVRSVKPSLVFELGFEGINRSTRHKSGIAVRFPRMLRIRDDKPMHEADTMQTLEALLGAVKGAGAVDTD